LEAEVPTPLTQKTTTTGSSSESLKYNPHYSNLTFKFTYLYQVIFA